MLNALKKLPEDAAFETMPSPVGQLWLIASKQGLHALLWESDLAKHPELNALFKRLKKQSQHPVLQETKSQLKEYFAGKRKKFSVPLSATGTEFQQQAWQALRQIPYGKTISYQEQAIKIGDIKKTRAVGTANSRNPISIIVPCHRVIAKSGALRGFAGGLESKKLLLDLEKKHL